MADVYVRILSERDQAIPEQLDPVTVVGIVMRRSEVLKNVKKVAKLLAVSPLQNLLFHHYPAINSTVCFCGHPGDLHELKYIRLENGAAIQMGLGCKACGDGMSLPNTAHVGNPQVQVEKSDGREWL